MAEAATAPSRDQVALGNPSFVWRAGQDRRLSLVRRYVPLEGARMLDIGCGIGTYVRKLQELSQRVYGIDIEPGRVRQGKTGSLAVGISERLPFANGAFDLVLLNEVIEHVQDEAATLREACRVARPGGHVVIYAPNRLYPFETHGVYIGKRYVFGNMPLINWLPDPLRDRFAPHVRAYTGRGLRRLFAGQPVRLVHHRVIYPGFDNITARHARLGRVLRRVLYVAEHTPLHIFGLSHVLVLRKVQGTGHR